MVEQSKPSPTVIPVSCPHCQQKQAIHVVACGGVAQLGNQTINCVKCKAVIDVTVPDQIVGGPFVPPPRTLEYVVPGTKPPLIH